MMLTLLNVFLIVLLAGLPTAVTVALLRMDRRADGTQATAEVTDIRPRDWGRAA